MVIPNLVVTVGYHSCIYKDSSVLNFCNNHVFFFVLLDLNMP